MAAPTPLKQFEDETCLLPAVIMRQVLEQEMQVWHDLPEADRNWLLEHYSLRLRYLDSTSPTMHRVFRRDGNSGRDEAYRWARHWAEAFVEAPAKYKRAHSEEDGQPLKGN
jgi:hypothetical protein